MKFFVPVLFCILTALPVLAAEKKVEQAVLTPQKQAAPQETKNKSLPPVKTNFQPTERIKADTVVAFPADI